MRKKNPEHKVMIVLRLNYLKSFWNDLNFSSQMQSLLFYSKQGSYFQHIGIYFMFTKKVTQNMKNWRPITLINALYKHISGCISYQIRPTLSYIISDTQTCSLKRRYIGKNTRFIQNLHLFTDNENIHGLLFLIDIQKAFHSVSWSFIYKALN